MFAIIIIIIIQHFGGVPLVILLSFLLFPSYPLSLRISALDFCSHLIFMCFWTNTSPPWRASYRNTINFNPAVSLLPRPSSPATFVFMAYYLNFLFMWVHSNDLKYRSRLSREKVVTLASILATWTWWFLPVMFSKLMILLWFNFGNNILVFSPV